MYETFRTSCTVDLRRPNQLMSQQLKCLEQKCCISSNKERLCSKEILWIKNQNMRGGGKEIRLYPVVWNVERRCFDVTLLGGLSAVDRPLTFSPQSVLHRSCTRPFNHFETYQPIEIKFIVNQYEFSRYALTRGHVYPTSHRIPRLKQFNWCASVTVPSDLLFLFQATANSICITKRKLC